MELKEAQAAVDEQQAALTRVTDERDRLIAAAYHDGASAAKIAEAVGLTRQHVHRIAARDYEYADDMGADVCPKCGTSYFPMPGEPNDGHDCPAAGGPSLADILEEETA